MFTAVCAISTVMVGSASLSRVGSTGPVRIVERVSIALAGAGEGTAGFAIAAGPSAAVSMEVAGSNSRSSA